MSAPRPRLGVAHPTVVPTTCRSPSPDGADDPAETDASTADAPTPDATVVESAADDA